MPNIGLLLTGVDAADDCPAPMLDDVGVIVLGGGDWLAAGEMVGSSGTGFGLDSVSKNCNKKLFHKLQ